FRYLKIQLVAASPDFDFAIDDLWFDAVTSAPQGELPAASLTPRMRGIHDAGVQTLAECMQTVYEDGPKRDRRLWAGDLYLQAQANKYTFGNYDLTRRCLYLFAGLSDSNGVVISNIFESPRPHAQTGSYCVSYSLLWNSTLLDYLKDTDDYDTASDLWPVARRQIENALPLVGDDGLFSMARLRPAEWLFFDWRDGLNPSTPMQGALIFALDQSAELAELLGHSEDAESWRTKASQMRTAARNELFDSRNGMFISGADRQLSIQSQIWMVKAGGVQGDEAAAVLTAALNHNSALRCGTPYAMHYLVEAMIDAGMHTQARQSLEDYWGGMVDKGADTFWESYDPGDDFISAYRFSPLNSACHAWSCTPVYFIHKYPEIFQK
ncbi:MAG: sugar hydrolase, partial [Roseburia sp.]|nr:sugar hydrolase [Roseburia sp.]